MVKTPKKKDPISEPEPIEAEPVKVVEKPSRKVSYPPVNDPE